MLKAIFNLLVIIQCVCFSQAQSGNPLICDMKTGLCGHDHETKTHSPTNDSIHDKKIKILYFTDPICSSCWGIEPQLRKLSLEYGHIVDIEYRMGGLLKDWSYNSGGISGPKDVAPHWEAASRYYDMPIDGDIWLEDPLESSFPVSIALKAATIQDVGKAHTFLRKLRELVFLEKRNINRKENLSIAAMYAGLDTVLLYRDMNGKGKELFDQDLYITQTNGVRGFPTLYFFDKYGNQQVIYGSKAYAFFETAILTLYPDAEKKDYDRTPMALFGYYPTMTWKEFHVLSGLSKTDAEKALQSLTLAHKIREKKTKNGSIWEKI